MGKHALLSASSSHRWINCPPSARLCEQYEDKGNNPRSAMVQDGKRYPRKKGNGKNSFQDVKNEVHRLNLEHLQ